ncbi:hypothetical protein [Sphingomonas sp. MA1305]|uniref:hypothetical protein n=1 Tax=Sphingomonas sp. MA1305 TaxID=2479204 RepID=UPI0018DF545F|nr:hypothetical protein [Sphingomonas sp. MA1305]
MGEITTPLLVLAPGLTYTAGSDGALIITDQHSHADILRYVVSDVGVEHAHALLNQVSSHFEREG